MQQSFHSWKGSIESPFDVTKEIFDKSHRPNLVVSKGSTDSIYILDLEKDPPLFRVLDAGWI